MSIVVYILPMYQETRSNNPVHWKIPMLMVVGTVALGVYSCLSRPDNKPVEKLPTVTPIVETTATPGPTETTTPTLKPTDDCKGILSFLGCSTSTPEAKVTPVLADGTICIDWCGDKFASPSAHKDPTDQYVFGCLVAERINDEMQRSVWTRFKIGSQFTGELPEIWVSSKMNPDGSLKCIHDRLSTLSIPNAACPIEPPLCE